MLLGEGQSNAVFAARRRATLGFKVEHRVIDDCKERVGVVPRSGNSVIGEQEAHADHKFGFVGLELQQFSTVGSVLVGNEFVGLDAEVGDSTLNSRSG